MKILILRLSSLGDIILTQPICAILQQVYPQAEIYYLCKPAFIELPSLFAPPVKVIAYQKSLAFHLSLRQEKYDLVLDLHGKLASWLIRLCVRCNKSAVYDKKRALRKAIVQGKSFSIDSTVSLYTTCLAKLGINAPWKYPRLTCAPLPTAKSFANKGKQLIAIFPGATHFTKRYPIQSWIELIGMNQQYHFALFGSRDDYDTCAEICQHNPEHSDNLAGRYNFGELLSVLSGFDLVISGDTGPMHLAASLSKPQIAIFGGTHPRLGFKPLNDKAIILCAGLACQPCSLHGRKACPQGHFNCMLSISPETVSDSIRKVLA